jgi:hypothetical protein
MLLAEATSLLVKEKALRVKAFLMSATQVVPLHLEIFIKWA